VGLAVGGVALLVGGVAVALVALGCAVAVPLGATAGGEYVA
jgi:hypothetical protein